MKKRLILALITIFILSGILWLRDYVAKQGLPAITTPGILNRPPKDAQPAKLTQIDTSELVETAILLPRDHENSVLTGKSLQAPKGIRVNLFADGLGKARMLGIHPSGHLMLTDSTGGIVYILPDRDEDGFADQKIVFADKLNFPHGIAVYEDFVFIAEENQVIRMKDTNGDLEADEKQVIISNLPTGGNHRTRTITIGPDEKLYLSIGSSCNICKDNPNRAAILRYQMDGSGKILFAAGLRNAVGIVFHPETGELWATDNGRDWLGDDLPPDEINIVKEGLHYGWPFCYGEKIIDPDLGDEVICEQTESPKVSLQAHSAPLGLRFITNSSLPDELMGDLLVAYHGSWNRSIPTGYKIVRIDMQDNKVTSVQDFITGWLNPAGSAWGRPVDIIQGSDGEFYISDDKQGVVYRITLPG